MSESTPLLSIGMIFKNEIRCLERCLKSLQPLREAVPCELVMADTGSDDGSREVAARYADILIDFPWVNDFAAARNAVLDRCSGTWYLTVDSDEWMEDIQPLVEFLREPEEQKQDLALITQFNYCDSEDKTQYNAAPVGRLARLHGGLLHYTGKIHEALCYDENPLQAQRRLDIVLYHDGYIYTSAAAQKAKSERNMTLLREALRDHPYNLHTLIQCIQSAYDGSERLKYAKRTIRALGDRRTRGDARRSGAYQNAIAAAYMSEEFDLVLDWLAEGLAELPQSVFLRIDGCSLALQVKFDREDYAGAVEYGKPWREGLGEYREKRDELNELTCGWLNFADEYHLSHCAALLTVSALRAEEWELAQELLDEQANRRPTKKLGLFRVLVEEVLRHAGEADGRTYLQAQWDRALAELESEDKAEAGSAGQRVGVILNAAGEVLDSGQRTQALETLVALGDRDPARSARILLSEDPEVLRRELAGTKNWDHIFIPAVLHIMERGVPLTENFFRMPSETMMKYASMMPQLAEHFSTLVLNYIETEDTESSLPRLLWAVVLTSAALRKGEWEDGEDAALCALFASLEGDYLGNLYRLDALEECDLPALPPLHRFGWRLLRGVEALGRGDAAEYVRLVREGVKDAPDMSKAAAALCEHLELFAPAPAPDPELLALAEQVRSVLARYAPDDPAVAELKASPMYQKVENLLEEVQPLTEAALRDPVQLGPVQF